MKADEPSSSSTKHGDISPINGSISSLAEEAKASTSSSKPPRKAEPSFEILPNFSRVTPAQLAHIVFPSDGRYQPVRAVSTKTPASIAGARPPVAAAGSKSPTATLGLVSDKYAGGGGILILEDLRPHEEAKYIEFAMPTAETPAQAQAQPAREVTPNGQAIAGSGPHIALDESSPDANPPESFEVR
jgi:26S proteasome regulatory subunit N2